MSPSYHREVLAIWFIIETIAALAARFSLVLLVCCWLFDPNPAGRTACGALTRFHVGVRVLIRRVCARPAGPGHVVGTMNLCPCGACGDLTFPEAAELLEEWMLGQKSGHNSSEPG
jgi:hypothetical protein